MGEILKENYNKQKTKIEIQTVIDQEIIKSWELDLDKIRLDLNGNVWIKTTDEWKDEELVEKCSWKPYAIYDQENDRMLIDIAIMPNNRINE